MSAAKKKMVESELLLLPDGSVMVHNLTPALARLLHELDPRDSAMKSRGCSGKRAEAIPARPAALNIFRGMPRVL